MNLPPNNDTGQPIPYTLRMIPAAALLPPLDPARGTFDEERLQDLINSVSLFGIIQPLVVETCGDMYRVHAGHRRMIASQAVGLALVPACVYPADYDMGEAIKAHENAVREDLNVAEEACYFRRQLDKFCGGDVDLLCARVQQSRQHVEGRLLLLAGDPAVFAALERGLIGIGVAQEFNKIENDARRAQYLDAAIRGGVSIRMARTWRVQGNEMDKNHPADPLAPLPTITDNGPVAPTTGACIFCGKSDEPWDLEVMFAHKACNRVAQREAERRAEANNGG